MKTVYLVDAYRTPFGSFMGGLAELPAHELASIAMAHLLTVHAIPGSAVDDVMLGQVLQGGAGQAPARQAMRMAGLPDDVHAMTINKVCGSGLQALMLGADAIMLGRADLVIAGGMESMSNAPYILPQARSGMRMGHGKVLDLLMHDGLLDPYSGRHMGEITEALIQNYGFTRGQQDEYAVRSYERAQKAIQDGIIAQEIAPVTIRSKKGDVVVDTDEDPFKVKFEKLPSLKPAFIKEGTITAANAPGINDGASVTLLASEDAVKKYGLKPLAKLIASSTHSILPDRFAEAPVGGIQKVLKNAGLSVKDIGLFEINEAFAAVAMMAITSLELDVNTVNVNGGAVAFGHPIGATGSRIAGTLAKEMARRSVQYGIASLCIGGGEAVSVVLERV